MTVHKTFDLRGRQDNLLTGVEGRTFSGGGGGLTCHRMYALVVEMQAVFRDVAETARRRYDKLN